MSERSLAVLGDLARWLRQRGGGGLLSACRNALDATFVRIGSAPLELDVDGLRLRGLLRHRSFLHGLAGRRYEPQLKRLFLEAAARAELVVDAGAHIGLYSLLASRVAGGEIRAFEADPYNFATLRLNLRRHRCPNVTAFNIALTDHEAATVFFQSEGTIGSSLYVRPDVGPIRPVPVLATTLDAALAPRSFRSILVKMDIEGAEATALRGMSRTLDTADDVVVIAEVNPAALAAAGFRTDDVVTGLRERSLEVFFIDEARERLVPIGEAELRKGNVVAVKGARQLHRGGHC